MVAAPSSVSVLSSMKSENVDIPVVIKFIIQIIYNRPKTEKTPGENCYQMLSKQKGNKKGNKKKFLPTKSFPPDQSSLKIKTLHCTFVLHTMVSCLNRHHLPLNPATYGWQKDDGFWVPVSFDGNAFPSAEKLTAISLGSIKIDNQEFNIVAENKSRHRRQRGWGMCFFGWWARS